jgi:hypothetical protein
MSLTTRRTLSWLGTLAVLAACGVGVTRLPGAGGSGLAGEVRYRITHGSHRPSGVDDASWLLFVADEQLPGTEVRVIKQLLYDPDERVVERALTVLTDRARFGQANFYDFRAWFDSASLDQKMAHLHAALACCAAHDIRPNQPYAFPELLLGVPLDDDNQRWFIVATLSRGADEREVADRMIARDLRPDTEVCRRLRILDALRPSMVDAARTCNELIEPINPPELVRQLRIDGALLLSVLSDPNAKLRWAAGRILTVAGDARGLPAFREWLQAHPRIPLDAEKMLTDLFGPDWRTSP